MQPTADSDSNDSASCKTLAELVCPLDTPQQRADLERFRIEFERQFGQQIDLTKRYTSTLSKADQSWLLENHPKRYWDGLPAFVQAYMKAKYRSAHSQGLLDDMPPMLRALYLSGQMEIASDGWTR